MWAIHSAWRRFTAGVHRLLDPVAVRLVRPRLLRLLRFVPSLPLSLRPDLRARRGAWGSTTVRVPRQLRTVPGIERDRAAEDRAASESPLHAFHSVHRAAVTWTLQHMWAALLPSAPRLMRAVARAARAQTVPGAPEGAADRHPVELTAHVRKVADRLGLSTIGIAPLDPRYTFAEKLDAQVGDRIIVCVLEQNFAATQSAPSARAERAAFVAYSELMRMAAGLADELVGLGYRAHIHGSEGEGINIHYAVEAGLGQLGLNGQLLTARAGSRCRLKLISTDAPLETGEPVDLGIPAVCDACRICVQRCPSGAIPKDRRPYRGVTKAKINTARCMPVVAQASGCSVCMKVCPVQRYGLQPVLDELEATGRVPGADTDELEGYTWPLDGRRYGPGERPTLLPMFFAPEGYTFDASATFEDENQAAEPLWS